MKITIMVEHDDDSGTEITRDFGNEVTLDDVLGFLKTAVDVVMGWSHGRLEYMDDMVESDEKEK